MDYDKFGSDLKDRLMLFKNDIYLSKRYSLVYLILLVLCTLTRFEMKNYLHPQWDILVFLVLAVMGVLCIAYYVGHSEDSEIHKTIFIVILIFGIIFSFVSPICFGPDEVEHFVRAELTSRGVFFPKAVNYTYQTIQSSLDLIQAGKISLGPFDHMDFFNSTVFHTTADTQPINNTLVSYPNVFAQNPFYGYLAPAIGMFIAKLFNLNAIWLLWLGRIFNTILYAGLVAVPVKKTPILKIPVSVFACIPFAIYLSATVSIDALIGGLSILATCYFLYLYKCPKITYKHIIKYTLLVVFLGTCKVTCFAFIILLVFLPRENFAEKKYYLYGFPIILISFIAALLWSRFYANPGFYQSGFRFFYCIVANVNPGEQINYMLANKKYTIMEAIRTLNHFSPIMVIRGADFNLLNFLFLGGVGLMYPVERFKTKARIGALLVGILVYIGTYLVFLLTWTPVGELSAIQGVQLRYFFPVVALIPFIFGFNHMDGDKLELDKYVVVLTIAFIAFSIIGMAVALY